ncbi:MAG: NAD(+) synthase [Proteobacteria bacterium]|nr:NAD(+) synthase [Pseudomonadota bacterium]MBU4471887.1 NAD(+) synthase [Pseudomonadota bacterium]MCG2752837.1 NAD(+) synthase [Desulfobacteraceae bacterium]
MKIQEVIHYIVKWLTDYCDKSHLNGFVVGVSGGIDSAVTSILCAKTGKKVYALNMPIYQSSNQVRLSANHIEWLQNQYPNVTGAKVDLTPVFQAYCDNLAPELQDGLTMANTRSRVRMITLYAFAGHHRLLVAGTGNKVEDFGVGFFTKYGDGGVDISPIADLMKTEVYEIGEKLGVMEEILQAPPTDGLWQDNRTDESQIGATYAELQWAMEHLEKPEDKISLNDRQKEILPIYLKFNRANKHKMEPIPVCKIPDDLQK